MIRALIVASAIAVLSSNAAAQLTPFCFPGQGGVLSCPCNNPPITPGAGCNNFGPTPPGGTGGAILSSTGTSVASPANSLSLVVTGVVGANGLTVVFMGSAPAPAGIKVGAGVRCVNGILNRIYRGSAPGGTIVFPNAGSPVDVWTASHMPPPGSVRHYFVMYRNPGASPSCTQPFEALNVTNSGSVLWM